MPVNDALGTRMKTFYEEIPKTKLMRRTPVAIRIDGRAFHTFTRGFKRPFDDILIQSMEETMLYLCKNIQGCVLGYHQSDEITLILTDYKKLNSDAWFDYQAQKMCSIAASMATLAFNRVFNEKVEQEYMDIETEAMFPSLPNFEDFKYYENIFKAHEAASLKGAMFDARCFNIPREEVTNLVYWRQLDAMRNSVQMVGQANFSHKQLDKKNQETIKKMLKDEKGIDWERDFATCYKRGTCCVRDYNGQWYVDTEIPIFKGENRTYIEQLIQQEEM